MNKMAKKTEVQTEKIEREYIIPLREKGRSVPRYKKAPKAVRSVKEFLARHMKIRDRDLNKVKIERNLNEFLWFRGIKNPPHKVKVKVVKEGEVVRAELSEIPAILKFKREKEKKMEAQAEEIAEKKKSFMQKAKEGLHKPAEEKQTEEEKKEEKEKIKAVTEAGKKMEKAAAQKIKHQAGEKTKQKHQFRKALAK